MKILNQLRLTTFASVAALTATSAFAGGVAPAPAAPMVVPVEDSSWTGFYGGVAIVGVTNSEMGYSDRATTFEYLEDQMETFFLGYDYQFDNNFVVGAEVSLSSGLEGVTGFPTETLEQIMALRLRGGYAFGDLLAYASVGLAASSFDVPAIPSNWDVTGEVYGIGVDYMVTDNIFAGLEYSMWDLSGDTNRPGQVQTSTIDAVSLRLGFRF